MVHDLRIVVLLLTDLDIYEAFLKRNSYFPLRCPKENSCGLIHTSLIKLVKKAVCVYVYSLLCVVSPSPGQIYCTSETNSWSQLMWPGMWRAVRPQPFQKTNKQNLVITQDEVKYGQLKVLTMCSKSEDLAIILISLQPTFSRGFTEHRKYFLEADMSFVLTVCLYFLFMDTELLSCYYLTLVSDQRDNMHFKT